MDSSKLACGCQRLTHFNLCKGSIPLQRYDFFYRNSNISAGKMYIRILRMDKWECTSNGETSVINCVSPFELC